MGTLFSLGLSFLHNVPTRMSTSQDIPRGGGGSTWVLFGWVCAAWDSKLAPRYKKTSPKIDTPVLEMGQFFIPHSRIRPKTDTLF